MKILLVDDQKIVANSFKLLFADYGHETIIGEIECEPLIKTIKKNNPDLLLVDIELGKKNKRDNGIKLTNELIKIEPELKIILFSGYDSFIFQEEAKRCGAKGFISKSSSTKNLLSSLEQVYNNGNLFHQTDK